MKCPWCHAERSEVTNTIARYKDDAMIKRHRRCRACGKTWATYESYQDGVDYAGVAADPGKVAG